MHKQTNKEEEKRQQQKLKAVSNITQRMITYQINIMRLPQNEQGMRRIEDDNNK